MRLARTTIGAELLQWFGLLGAGLVWAAWLVLGFGVTVANCGRGGQRWGIDLSTWQVALMAAAGALVVLSWAAAISIVLETRGREDSDPPPWGRRHFFAVGAALGDVLFLVIIVIGGIAAVVHPECRQA